MASTLYSDAVASGEQAGSPGANVFEMHSTYALAAALVINDVIQMLKVQKGTTILDIILDVPDLDSGGTPSITLSVGDGGSVSRYISAATTGQAGGVTRLSVAGGSHYTYTADDTIDIKVIAAPETGATSGTIKLTAICTRDVWEN